jgi:hypothetical protein
MSKHRAKNTKNFAFHLRALRVDACGLAVNGFGLRPLAFCERVFESSRGHGCLSVLSVV